MGDRSEKTEENRATVEVGVCTRGREGREEERSVVKDDDREDIGIAPRESSKVAHKEIMKGWGVTFVGSVLHDTSSGLDDKSEVVTRENAFVIFGVSGSFVRGGRGKLLEIGEALPLDVLVITEEEEGDGGEQVSCLAGEESSFLAVIGIQ